ncbi:MAG: hypothetical protein ABJG47_18505 [Ekhidna sp.]
MVNYLQLHRLRNVVFLLPIACIVACVFAANSSHFTANPSGLSLAITFDLLVTTPVIYFLIIRKRNIPKTTLVPVFILGIVIASIILPSEHQFYLSQVKTWFLPFLEIGVVTYLIITIRKAFRKFKQHEHTSIDFFTTAKTAAEDIMPKALSTAFATELSIFYYGFISWKKRELAAHEFSYHKTTSTRMILGVFVFLIIIEAFAVHLALQHWSATVAWILTILSIYACLQVFGIVRSLSKRPVTIEDDALILKYGVMGESMIPLSQIKAVREQTKSLTDSKEIVYLSPFKDMEGHNVVIEVERPAQLASFYGFKKTYSTIVVYLDDPKAFVNELAQAITPST